MQTIQAGGRAVEADDTRARTALVAALAGRREALGWTVAQVAQRMQVAHATVAAIERRETDPRLSLLQQYARVVGLRLAVAVEEDKDSRPATRPNGDIAHA